MIPIERTDSLEQQNSSVFGKCNRRGQPHSNSRNIDSLRHSQMALQERRTSFLVELEPRGN